MKFIILILFFSIFLVSSGEASEKIPFYDLIISIDVQRSLLKGKAVIQFFENSDKNIFLADLVVLSVKHNGQEYAPEITNNVIKVKGEGIIEIIYEGRFNVDNLDNLTKNSESIKQNMIVQKGVVLRNCWYPYFEGLANYSLKAVLPKGFTALSEADEIIVINKEQASEYLFNFTHPLPALTLIAGIYSEVKENFQGIDIYGYFPPEERDFIKTYIKKAIEYLKLYTDLFYPYPYKRFSIVKSFLPVSYSVPTLAVLGEDVLILPVDNLISRYVIRQWFGNSVYIDYTKGNWAEGLTAYFSEHLISEKKNEGWRYRKKLLVDYKNLVDIAKEFPLKDFKNGNDLTQKAIGQGKSAMLFHMLKNLIGDDALNTGLKEFIKNNQYKIASWDDLKETFEKGSNKDLSWFFDQWLKRKGIPVFEVKEPREIVLKGVPTASFEIIQKSDPYIIDIGVKIKTDRSDIHQILHLEKEREYLEIPIQGSLREIIFDMDYNVMREITEKENYPVISSLFRDGKKYIVVPDNGANKYEELIHIFEKQGFVLINENEISNEDIKASSLIILDLDNQVLKRLFGSIKEMDAGLFLFMKKNPLNLTNAIAIVHADSKEEVDFAAGKISYYTDYSFVRFEKGMNVEKKLDDSERGIVTNLYEPVTVIQPKNAQILDKAIEDMLDKPIIYVGERHTNYEDHRVQLKIIMSMYEKGHKFAIGMEMFQKPFQKTINEYLSGIINEKQFLKGTQYFSRWQFDYKLYREIIEFAKAKNIPIVALNQWTEIVRKVASEGLDSLTDIEKMEIPNEMDMSDEDYKIMLKGIFEQHRNHEIKDFDTFYQSQIIWDETMASSINDFMNKNPEYKMIVLAGVGHIMYDYGIPKRVYRLNGKDYITIIPGIGSLDEDISNFVFLTSQQQAPLTLKLGVSLKKIDGWLKIEKVIPGSIAKSAGLKKGDIIVALDDWKIEDIDDIPIFMIDKKRGDNVKIKILRRGLLTGYKEYEFEVTL